MAGCDLLMPVRTARTSGLDSVSLTPPEYPGGRAIARQIRVEVHFFSGFALDRNASRQSMYSKLASMGSFAGTFGRQKRYFRGPSPQRLRGQDARRSIMEFSRSFPS